MTLEAHEPFRPDLLRGKTTIVTGGGTGLGRTMAMRMAGLGAKVALLGRRKEPLEATAGEIRQRGGEAAAVPCDVRDPEAVRSAFDAAEKTLGPANQLVNNAAGNFLCASEELTSNAFDAVVRIVLHGTFHCTTELGRRLIARGAPGEVLAIVTTYTQTGSAFVLPSACAKAGVAALVRSLAVEWATYGIRLNAIAPGPFPTEGAFSRLMPGSELERQARRRIPSRRFGEHWELANLAAYLMSDASPYQTGDVVTIDGAEALFSGQQFGGFAHLERAAAKEMMAALKPKK
ncbi:MAG TPA: SDR family oxidoreductase [Vicinamibacteria bacterium]|nr:SDR family oxidoreductase [Vicinamibacteria bacterium]